MQLFSHFVLKVLSLFYKGNNVVCPVCDHHYRKFLPYGRNSRENALCPNCLALERHRLMWLFLKERTNFFTNKLKVLHVAPELCFINRFERLKNLDYTTADIESPLAKVKMDIHEIPFEDGSFDVVICNHVLEHVTDDRKALSEIMRVLKPGGWSILQVPVFHPLPEKTLEDPSITDPKEREKLYGQDDHVRLYGLDYKERLEGAGFQVDKMVVTEMEPSAICLHALPTDDPIFHCIKPS